jgi:hypothetical protein
MLHLTVDAGVTFLRKLAIHLPDYTISEPRRLEYKLYYDIEIRRGADNSLAIPISLFAAQPKEFFLVGLKKLEQRSHKCVELKGEYVE